LAHQENGQWLHFSTQDCISHIDQVSAGLIDLGLKKGDKLGLIFESGSAYFNFLDFALLQLGVISIPIHANILSEELSYILQDAGIKTCIVSSEKLYQKVDLIRGQLQDLKQVISIEPIEGLMSWKDLLVRPEAKHLKVIEERKASIQEEDLATIIYTSGSSGIPKGVMLSHKNMVSNIKSTIALVPINCDKRVISFLPISHVFERMVSFTYIAVGASVFYIDRIENVMPGLKKVKPHYFTSVPKLLERIYDDVERRSKESGALKRKIIKWALKIGERYEGPRSMGAVYSFQRRLASILVYRQWRNALGGKVEGVVVGAAALQPKLGKLFSAAGIEIREGYGLTETSPGLTIGRFDKNGAMIGTVGAALPDVELLIDPSEGDYRAGEGEILAKGPNIMKGYYRQPEKTAEVTKEVDGVKWFRTGDIGKLIPGPAGKQFLKITDRKKELLKTSGGKYVAPAPIENKFKEDFPYRTDQEI